MQYLAMLERIEGAPQYHFLWNELPIEERIPAAARYGFDGVDFWDWYDKDIDTLARIAADNGVFINSVFAYRKGSLCNSDDHQLVLDQFKESLEMAERCGVKALFLQTDEVGEGGNVIPPARPHTRAERWAELEEGIARVIELVDNSGVDVDLLVEPLSQADVHGYLLRTSQEGYDLIAKFDAPRVKLVFDLYHEQINAGNLIQSLRNTFNRVGAIHISNVPGRGAPGTGEIDIAAIWREMQALGYDGPVGFETVPGTASTEETLAKVKEIFPWPAA